MTRERGSAPIESIFAIVFLVVLFLGTVEIALLLYGRNVVISSTHEAARAAVEIGRLPGDAAAIAHRSIERAAGGFVDGLDVSVSRSATKVTVAVKARVSPPGPVPLWWPMRVRATVSRSSIP